MRVLGSPVTAVPDIPVSFTRDHMVQIPQRGLENSRAYPMPEVFSQIAVDWRFRL